MKQKAQFIFSNNITFYQYFNLLSQMTIEPNYCYHNNYYYFKKRKSYISVCLCKVQEKSNNCLATERLNWKSPVCTRINSHQTKARIKIYFLSKLNI